jgi:Holliday junction resolvase
LYLWMLILPKSVVMVDYVLQLLITVTSVLQRHLLISTYTRASPKHTFFVFLRNNFYLKNSIFIPLEGIKLSTEVDRIRLRRWRKRGFYSETVLVKLLLKKGYNAVRVPVSNPSLSPLPDLMARKGQHVYAFEVKNASYYAYFPKPQIDKLFRFLDQFIPTGNENKHAVVAAHLGKRWLFKEISWTDWEKDKLPDKVRILKRDRGNLNIDKSYQQ